MATLTAAGDKKSSPIVQDGISTKHIFFSEGNIPPHHYDTVKMWIHSLLKQALEFSLSFQKKVKKQQDAKLFNDEAFKLGDINDALKCFLELIDSSVLGLNEFQTLVTDYISTWKVALAEGIEDDSSEDDIPTSEPKRVTKLDEDSLKSKKDKDILKSKKAEDILKSKKTEDSLKSKKAEESPKSKKIEDSLKSDNSEESPKSKKVEDSSKSVEAEDSLKSDNPEDGLKPKKADECTPRIRVRNICELNSLNIEEITNTNSNLSSTCDSIKPDTKEDNIISSSSSSDECIICSNDEDVVKPKVNSKVSRSSRRKIISLDSSSSEEVVVTSTSKEVVTPSKEVPPLQETSKSAKSTPAKSVVTLDSSDDDDDCVITESPTVMKFASKKSVKSEDEKDNDSTLKEKKTLNNNTTKTPINWDTSSSVESERSWVLSTTKTKKKLNENEKKKRKDTIEKKNKNKSKSNDFSSSDEDSLKLCNLKSLKRRRKLTSSDSDSSKENSKPQRTKTPKKTKTDVSLMDCMNSNDSDDLSEMDMNLNFLDNLKTLNSASTNNAAVEDLLRMNAYDTDNGLDVLTDSSLDSLVNILEAGQAKVNRGTSKSKKENVQGDKKKSSRRRTRDKLLDAKLTDTDTTEGEEKWKQYKMKTRIDSSDSGEENEVAPVKKTSPKPRETRNSRKSKKSLFSDDSDAANLSDSSESEEKLKSDEEKDKDVKDEEEEDEDEETKKENKRKRKRIQRQSDSSEEDEDGEPSPNKGDGKGGRRNIRKVLKEESLEKSTKEALKEEEERKRRIAEKQKLYNNLLIKTIEGKNEVKVIEELVLDFDVETKEPLVSVDKDLVKKLKPHQAEGIKFMWDACFESVKDANESRGSGCILAHCMGLGKTLQVITLVHTLLTNEKVDVNRVLVVAPFSTVQNWVNEFRKWLKDVGSGEDFEVYNMIKTAVNHRSYQLRDWERTGGVMVLGYNMFRTLVSPKGRMKAALKKSIQEVLLDPGPDVVICDEGHILKNEKTAVNIAMSKVRTLRRIVLTGTPLQNNLVEYHCMVQFVKPNLLGTRKEFQNRFVHPIQNGQFEDSTAHDVKIMKRRAHVLHKMLDGIVQRKDYNVLTPYLPPKYEYVIHVKLTEVQIKLYRHYLDNLARKSKNEGGGLFQDFQHLLRICTHPRSLLIHSDKEVLKREYEEDSEGSLKDFIDDDSDSEHSSAESMSSKSSSGSGSDRCKTPPPKKRNTRAARAAAGNISSEEEELAPPKRTEWWSDLVTEEELADIRSSSKLFLFFTILKHCEEIGDKLLVFSQSLYTLDLIEQFLQLVEENARKSEEEQIPSLSQFSSNWDKGLDYFRLDGGTSSDNRANWCKIFNNANNTRARLFLISTRAGGLGINLTGANRVIIFDASWNPSFDVQSIFRVYRFGQVKPCYIYRFLSKGTMEEKIYERQVAKLSTSLRVIDEQQIDRHFTQTSLAELYAFNPDPPENRETPALPKDRLMAELLQSYSDMILKHHQHDSLLENQEDEELNEEERKAAWQDFENEKNNVPPPNPFLTQQPIMNQGFLNPAMSFNLQAQVITESLISKIKAQNPNLDEEFVKKRAIEVLQSMPFWRNQTLMNTYVQQQQNQYYQQQQYLQQQQLMLAQQQARMNNFAPNVGDLGNKEVMKNGAQALLTVGGKSGPSQTPAGPSQPIEIQDD